MQHYDTLRKTGFYVEQGQPRRKHMLGHATRTALIRPHYLLFVVVGHACRLLTRGHLP